MTKNLFVPQRRQRRQLLTQPRVWPLSWHRTYLLCQELEEEMIVFILLMKTSGGSQNVEVQTIFWS